MLGPEDFLVFGRYVSPGWDASHQGLDDGAKEAQCCYPGPGMEVFCNDE